MDVSYLKPLRWAVLAAPLLFAAGGHGAQAAMPVPALSTAGSSVTLTTPGPVETVQYWRYRHRYWRHRRYCRWHGC